MGVAWVRARPSHVLWLRARVTFSAQNERTPEIEDSELPEVQPGHRHFCSWAGLVPAT